MMWPISVEEDVEHLQGDFEASYNWQKRNNIHFNCTKFEISRYGPNEEVKQSTMYFTTEFEDTIDAKEQLRDLGVIMSSDAKFKAHVDHVCTKVKQKCGRVLRTFNCRSVTFMKFIWKSLIQGHIDYCI